MKKHIVIVNSHKTHNLGLKNANIKVHVCKRDKKYLKLQATLVSLAAAWYYRNPKEKGEKIHKTPYYS